MMSKYFVRFKITKENHVAHRDITVEAANQTEAISISKSLLKGRNKQYESFTWHLDAIKAR